jgi:hypothetical protein
LRHNLHQSKEKKINQDIKKITLQQRRCECCGGDDIDPVWAGEEVVRRAKHTWLFPFSVVVCKECGFAFNSPAPSENDLISYYSDGLSGYKEIGLPYSIDARVEILKKYSSSQWLFAEIGGDQPGEFHERIRNLYSSLILVDLSDDCTNELRNINQLPENSVDVIAHYDVLEHIASVKTFLTSCHRALKCNGIMICEVPNIRLYPRNLLLQEFTHTNHFSITTLSAIASQCGFELLEVSHRCSRPYGFLAVFQKTDNLLSFKPPATEYLDSWACLRGGIAQIKSCENHINFVREQVAILSSKKNKIIIWGVTDLLRALIENLSLANNVLIVDSDPRRKDHLIERGIQVYLPENVLEHIRSSVLLVICAPRYQHEINNWIVEKTGKSFSGSSLQVIGSGPNGETLR